MSGSQKFISRNRAPRVQIEYDVELYGAEKKVQLPFVMGVMSDLSGKTKQPSLSERSFLEIDVDNFNDRMSAMAPTAQFAVPNTLTGDGNLSVDLTFKSIDDFSPEAVARNVDALRPLLEAREQLTNLMTYMDGKAGAENLIEQLLAQPALLHALAGTASDTPDVQSALDSLRSASAQNEEAPVNGTADTLAGLAAQAPVEAGPDTSVRDALATLTPPPETAAADTTGDVLAGIARVEETETVDRTDDILAGIEPASETDEGATQTEDVLAGIERSEDVVEQDTTSDVLASLEPVVETAEDVDHTSDVLSAIERTPDTDEIDTTDDVLANLEAPPTAKEHTDETGVVLSAIERVETPEPEDTTADVLSAIDTATADSAEVDNTDDVLASLEAAPEAPAAIDETNDVLSGIERVQDAPSENQTDDILAGIEARDETAPDVSADDVLATIKARPDTVPETDDLDDVLAGLEAPTDETAEVDDTAAILAGIEAPEPAEEEDALDDILAGIDGPGEDETADTTDDILAGLEAAPTNPTPEDSADDILAGIDAPPENDATDGTADILAGLEAPPADAAPEDSAEDILAGIETPKPMQEDAGENTTDDVLAGLETTPTKETVEDSADDILAGIEAQAPAQEEDALDDILAGLDAPDDAAASDTSEDILAAIDTPDAIEDDDGLDDILAGLDTPEPDTSDSELDDLLAELDAGGASTDPDDLGADQQVVEGTSAAAVEDTSVPDANDGADDLDDLLADLEAPLDDTADNDLDDLLADLASDDDAPLESAVADEADDLDALLADLDATDVPSDDDDAASTTSQPETGEDDLDALLADLESDEPIAIEEDDAEDDLDALLADLDAADPEPVPSDDEATTPEEPDAEDDLDALLADLAGDDSASTEDDGDDLDALLADLDADTSAVTDEDGGDDLDTLLADLDADERAPDTQDAPANGPPINPFGTVSVQRPHRDSLNRKKFRMALFGDFTGRAARGLMETGDALAARAPIELDVDTVEEVIEGFGTELTLPIGKDGMGIAVKLSELDDLHPDELYENIEIFEALSGLRQQLGIGSMAEKAAARLQEWSETYRTPIKLPKRSASTSIPPNKKLSDFQALIGDTTGTLTQASPADDLIAQIVGPHVVKAPDAGSEAMLGAVDNALSAAMRLVLHHPDFQAVEAQWRSLDMLARRIETDSTLQIVLYDISAEEIAADLAAHEDLAQSGLFRLVTNVLDPEEGAGGFSALFGLYTFEETPPHAELLARIGAIAAHVDAPFFAAMGPGYLETAKEDRHPLVAKAWDALRNLPEAGYIGLTAPRFLLRMPYGKKSDPISAFEFEEFTPQEGLSGMLWANPVVLVAILLAGTYKKDGRAMDLGSLMSLGDIPFHYVTDRHGDQVALPCTERNLTEGPAQHTKGRGFMPVLWMKGRNEVRLGSFQALSGETITGPWSGAVPAKKPAPDAKSGDIEFELTAVDDTDETDEASLDDLLAGFDDDSDDDTDLAADDDEMDPELAALLEGL